MSSDKVPSQHNSHLEKDSLLLSDDVLKISQLLNPRVLSPPIWETLVVEPRYDSEVVGSGSSTPDQRLGPALGRALGVLVSTLSNPK